jgi:hypothetical protein
MAPESVVVSAGRTACRYCVAKSLDGGIGILHWGQRNDADADDIQRLFGDSTSPTNGDLGAWRHALDDITDGGALARFSSDFTRRTGLEP